MELSLETADKLDTAVTDLQNAITKAYESGFLKKSKPSIWICPGETKSQLNLGKKSEDS